MKPARHRSARFDLFKLTTLGAVLGVFGAWPGEVTVVLMTCAVLLAVWIVLAALL